MNVEFITPEKKMFTGEATGVKLPGIKGSFEILSNHAPLISALGKGVVRITTAKEGALHLQITGGFVEVLNNSVVVLAESAKMLNDNAKR